ncbi:MAG: hypothetical protein V1652_04380 [bacterium]
MKKIVWTNHAKGKMRYYGLSEGRVMRVLRVPERIEVGIAEHTAALMQPVANIKHPYEIWVMIQDFPEQQTVISAWRYPGRTKLGEPLPAEIIREIKSIVL